MKVLKLEPSGRRSDGEVGGAFSVPLVVRPRGERECGRAIVRGGRSASTPVKGQETLRSKDGGNEEGGGRGEGHD